MRVSRPLHRQIINVLSARKTAALVHSIASEVTATRHEGRVHSALLELREEGVVTWCTSGWRLTQADDRIEERCRAA